MHQIKIQSLDDSTIFRVIQAPSDMTLFDLDSVIKVAFAIEDDSEVFFESIRTKGKKYNEIIPLFADEFEYYTQFDSVEEEIGEWFVKRNDEMHYTNETGVKLKLVLEQITEVLNEESFITAGQGNIFSKGKKVDINKLNQTLKEELELDKMLFDEIFNDEIVPDYFALFTAADNLKKLKPWNYFTNDEIIAIEFEGMNYFVSVMGAGGQEFGLMIYDEQFGYRSLEKLIYREPLSDEFAIELSALTVNYVNRDELEKEDYELIKELGFSYRGAKNWIAFRVFEPGLIPMLPEGENVGIMTDLIEMIIALTKARMEGWTYPNVSMNSFPLFTVNEDTIEFEGIIEMNRVENYSLEIAINDLDLAKFKKKPKSTTALEMDWFYIQQPIVDDEQAIYPLITIAIDADSGFIVAHEIVPLPKNTLVIQQLFWLMLNESPVLPNKVIVSEEMYPFVTSVAKYINVNVVASKLPNVAAFKEDFKNGPF